MEEKGGGERQRKKGGLGLGLGLGLGFGFREMMGIRLGTRGMGVDAYLLYT